MQWPAPGFIGSSYCPEVPTKAAEWERSRALFHSGQRGRLLVLQAEPTSGRNGQHGDRVETARYSLFRIAITIEVPDYGLRHLDEAVGVGALEPPKPGQGAPSGFARDFNSSQGCLMTAAKVIEEILHLPREEQSRVLEFVFELARKRQLSGKELTALAQRMVDSEDPAEVEGLKSEITRGFYGD